ncbi:zeta toxin family protein [Achromobacter aloeverae]|nr:zeta toxin family protein [Achromobacter aloeverae]
MAGPNGSGKTSVIQAIEAEYRKRSQDSLPNVIINPDVIRKLPETLDLARAEGLHPDRAAQKVAFLHRQRAMEAGQAFAFETVMSHPTKLAELAELRAAGYAVQLVFISTKNADINVRRVAYRVRTRTTTGHDVPEDRTRERYARTMALLPAAIEHADHARLYDNSYDGQPYTRQASIEQEDVGHLAGARRFRIALTGTPEQWVLDAIKALELRQAERDQCNAYAAEHGFQIQAADTVRGSYQGTHVDPGVSGFFCTVADADDRQVLTLHDFSSFTPRQVSELKSRPTAGDLSIAYSMTHEPKIGLPLGATPGKQPSPRFKIVF